MTAKWIPCGSGFIAADVVRWKERVWEKRSRRRNARAVNVGERFVTAEVLREDAEGWVHLLTRVCDLSSERIPGRKVTLLPKGETLRRKRRTIERGQPERLLWSDESARAIVASKFLGSR
ncbi:MAG: hypothetical protein ABR860_11645 [Terracidiphilus sp.]